MPKSCAARQCCNRYSSRRKQLTFHRFPFSRPELLKEWVLNIGRGNFEPKQHTVICSEHFRPECFSAFGNRKNLKHNAVPTEFAFRDARPVSYTPTGRQGGRADSEGDKAGLPAALPAFPGPPGSAGQGAGAAEEGGSCPRRAAAASGRRRPCRAGPAMHPGRSRGPCPAGRPPAAL
ncbi:THAP domain-containing protein 3 isoform X2 [Pipistrellus kuhlii]|uniref:THAP domain-containing protein 3 isoform X2 n=1 Tax=Pipistrellus kuhlii TaxID=59472 RepID=UPI001E2715EB|nr:THAP domain-containing protein 3 isoform X2 [Pipistrellus kuhlii]